jgi:ArsR family transcriptional regulator
MYTATPVYRSDVIAISRRIEMGSERLTSYAAPAKFLEAMANERRLFCLVIMARGEISVSTLAARVGLSRSALSQHLAIMRRFDLVTTRHDGQRIYYSCTDPVLRVMQLLVEQELLPPFGGNLKYPRDSKTH